MASGPQPAVEGTSSGSGSSAPAGPDANDGVAPRSGPFDGAAPRNAPARRPAETVANVGPANVGPGNGGPGNGGPGNGGPGNGGPGNARRTDARGRTAPAGRPGGATTLPVGRATPPDRRGVRHRAPTGPRVATGRRTRRVVRKIDVWTVLKLSFLFYLCVFLVFMVAGIVLWNIAQAFNVIHSVEKFIRSIFDLQKFTFRPTIVLQSSAAGGAVLVLLATGANVLAALIYNLISDIVGGVQFIVLEETAPPD